MLRIDPSKLRRAAGHLKHATDEHAEWHENLLRTVFCGLPVEREDLDPFAHRLCCIGRWYYEDAPSELREHAAFAGLGAEHERLHLVAAQLLRAIDASRPIQRLDFEELVAASARMRLEMDALRLSIDAELVNRDPLTGAYGRIAMVPELNELHASARRGGKASCIVFMDVDHLKRINDAHGHLVGDSVLAGTVHHIEAHLRPQDKLFRYGGDEFLISLPGADLNIGKAVITRIRDSLVQNLLITSPRGTAVRITASFGLALLDPDAEVTDCIGRADQALMLAKTAGRNRVISWDAAVTTSTRWRRIKVDEMPT